MYKIKIMNEFMHGALWVYDERGVPSFFDLIDNDDQLQTINKQIEDLYDSYYEFDSHDLPCWFNEEKEREDKPKMLALLKRMNDRLSELNDGSFEVEDLETERVKEL